MDWYSWLSKTGLNPSMTYEYGLLFNRNELEPGDAAHFDHDLLKSMGISIAKHRLEILKLAKKTSSSSSSPSRFLHRAKKCLGRCVRKLVRPHGGSSSVTVVPRICNGDDVRVGVQKIRSGKKMVLMITDGDGIRGGRLSASQKAGLMVHDCRQHDDDDDECSDSEPEAGGEIKWDSMFQDLKPT